MLHVPRFSRNMDGQGHPWSNLPFPKGGWFLKPGTLPDEFQENLWCLSCPLSRVFSLQVYSWKTTHQEICGLFPTYTWLPVWSLRAAFIPHLCQDGQSLQQAPDLPWGTAKSLWHGSLLLWPTYGWPVFYRQRLHEIRWDIHGTNKESLWSGYFQNLFRLYKLLLRDWPGRWLPEERAKQRGEERADRRPWPFAWQQPDPNRHEDVPRKRIWKACPAGRDRQPEITEQCHRKDHPCRW